MSPASVSPSAKNLVQWSAVRGDRTGVRPAPAPEALPHIQGYLLRRRIGEGRMAIAYLANDLRFGAEVVLKVLRREHAGSGERTATFVQEFAVPSGIRNSHVIRVFDQFIGDGHAVIAMEHLAGGDLGRLIRKGLTAAPAPALALLRQAAIALQALHQHGWAHGDIKPANLLLRSSGDLVLADFGLARKLDAPHMRPPAGTVVGTPCYAAPELAEGAAVAAAADVYSLGVVFYEMLCGRRPFQGETVMEVLCQHLIAPVPRLPAGAARFQPLLDAMLDKRVETRLQDGQALLAQIDLMNDAASLHPAPVGETGSRWLS